MTLHVGGGAAGGVRLSLDDPPSFPRVPHMRVEKSRKGCLECARNQEKDKDGFLCFLYISIQSVSKSGEKKQTQM